MKIIFSDILTVNIVRFNYIIKLSKITPFSGMKLPLTIPDVNSIKICKIAGIRLHLQMHVGENMPFKTTPKHYKKIKDKLILKNSLCIVSKACAFLIIKP